MIKTFLLLFFEFSKIGLFNFGGGYASLPFLYHLIDKYGWFSSFELTQMIALSGLTPGPIGLNMATYAGYKTLGIFGSLTSSFALVLPMLIITTCVFKLYKTFNKNPYVQKILYYLRPTSCALICSVGLKLFYELIMNEQLDFRNFDKNGLFLIILLFIATFKLNRNPIFYMLIGAIFGVVVKFFYF